MIECWHSTELCFLIFSFLVFKCYNLYLRYFLRIRSASFEDLHLLVNIWWVKPPGAVVSLASLHPFLPSTVTEKHQRWILQPLWNCIYKQFQMYWWHTPVCTFLLLQEGIQEKTQLEVPQRHFEVSEGLPWQVDACRCTQFGIPEAESQVTQRLLQ